MATFPSNITFSSSTPVGASSLVNGTTYIISKTGNTLFTSIGASSNSVGTVFTSSGGGSGTGAAVPANNTSTELNLFQPTSNTWSGLSVLKFNPNERLEPTNSSTITGRDCNIHAFSLGLIQNGTLTPSVNGTFDFERCNVTLNNDGQGENNIGGATGCSFKFTDTTIYLVPNGAGWIGYSWFGNHQTRTAFPIWTIVRSNFFGDVDAVNFKINLNILPSAIASASLFDNVSFWNGKLGSEAKAAGFQLTTNIIQNNTLLSPYGTAFNNVNNNRMIARSTNQGTNLVTRTTHMGLITNLDYRGIGNANNSAYTWMWDIDTGGSTMILNVLPGRPSSSDNLQITSVYNGTGALAGGRSIFSSGMNPATINADKIDGNHFYTFAAADVDIGYNTYPSSTTVDTVADSKHTGVLIPTNALIDDTDGWQTRPTGGYTDDSFPTSLGYLSASTQLVLAETVTKGLIFLQQTYTCIANSNSENGSNTYGNNTNFLRRGRDIRQLENKSYRKYSWLQQPDDTTWGKEVIMKPPGDNALDYGQTGPLETAYDSETTYALNDKASYDGDNYINDNLQTGLDYKFTAVINNTFNILKLSDGSGTQVGPQILGPQGRSDYLQYNGSGDPTDSSNWTDISGSNQTPTAGQPCIRSTNNFVAIANGQSVTNGLNDMVIGLSFVYARTDLTLSVTREGDALRWSDSVDNDISDYTLSQTGTATWAFTKETAPTNADGLTPDISINWTIVPSVSLLDDVENIDTFDGVNWITSSDISDPTDLIISLLGSTYDTPTKAAALLNVVDGCTNGSHIIAAVKLFHYTQSQTVDSTNTRNDLPYSISGTSIDFGSFNLVFSTTASSVSFSSNTYTIPVSGVDLTTEVTKITTTGNITLPASIFSTVSDKLEFVGNIILDTSNSTYDGLKVFGGTVANARVGHTFNNLLLNGTVTYNITDAVVDSIYRENDIFDTSSGLGVNAIITVNSNVVITIETDNRTGTPRIEAGTNVTVNAVTYRTTISIASAEKTGPYLIRNITAGLHVTGTHTEGLATTLNITNVASGGSSYKVYFRPVRSTTDDIEAVYSTSISPTFTNNGDDKTITITASPLTKSLWENSVGLSTSATATIASDGLTGISGASSAISNTITQYIAVKAMDNINYLIRLAVANLTEDIITPNGSSTIINEAHIELTSSEHTDNVYLQQTITAIEWADGVSNVAQLTNNTAVTSVNIFPNPDSITAGEVFAQNVSALNRVGFKTIATADFVPAMDEIAGDI